MFFCTSDMSKSDILRGIITEKLSTAAREILAVVERTVADYEEEASAFRQEIDRQRRQLELLQPQVRLHRGDVEEAESQSLPWSHDEDDEKHPETTSTQNQEDLKDPDYETPSRWDSSGAPSVSRRPGGAEGRDTQNQLGFRVRFLENSQIKVLSTAVFQKCPVQNLLCPRGLQEADFLDLLRSTFPLLANGEPFEMFLTSTSRKLLPLRAEPLTPEEISRSIRSSGNSALYIRLKKGEEEEDKKEEEPHVSPRTSEPPSDPELQTRSDSSRVPSVRRRVSRPKISDKQNHLDLRIWFLEDSGMEVLSNAVFHKCPVQNFRCPLGLQEADFLDLLRSTFPQLANDEPFDMFMGGCKRRLMPVRVNLLTPEEIYATMKFTGNSSLYIRLKTKAEKQEENEELEVFPRITDPPSADPVLLNNGTGLRTSPVDSVDHPRGGDLSNRSGPEQQDLETEEEEAENDVDSSNNGEEALDGDSDWTPDPELQTNREPREPRRKRLKRDVRKTKGGKLSCKVCGVWYWKMGSLIKHIWNRIDEQQDVCGVCGEKFESVEELKEHLRNHQDVHICSHCGKAFTSITSLNSHTTKHTGNSQFKCNICDKTFNKKSVLDSHRWVHVENKPHECDLCPKTFGLKSHLTAHRKMHSNKDKHVCTICGKSLIGRRALALHMFTHSEERRYGCEVCGKRFKLPHTLKSHMKTHTIRDKPFLCHICSKTFSSKPGLKAHMQSHSGEKPFVCDVCGKRYPSKGSLTIHKKVHSTERPFECSECGLTFKFKRHLINHILTHSGIKKFVCGICGKASSRQDHLQVHMRTHNGERPYKCTVCEKDFTQSHCLKTHMKSHQTEDIPVPENQTQENPVPENLTEESPVPENQTEENPVPENLTQENPVLGSTAPP